MTQEQRNISELERNAEYYAARAEAYRKAYARQKSDWLRRGMRNLQDKCAYYAAQIPA